MDRAGDIFDRGLSRNRAYELFGADGLPIGQAHDAVDAGNNLKIGGIARADFDGAVAAGDRVDMLFDRLGRLIECPHAPPASILQGRGRTSGSVEVTVLSSTGEGTRLYITSFFIGGEDNPTDWELRDGAGGTVLFSGRTNRGEAEEIVCESPVRLGDGNDLRLWGAGLAFINVTAVGYSLGI